MNITMYIGEVHIRLKIYTYSHPRIRWAYKALNAPKKKVLRKWDVALKYNISLMRTPLIDLA